MISLDILCSHNKSLKFIEAVSLIRRVFGLSKKYWNKKWLHCILVLKDRPSNRFHFDRKSDFFVIKSVFGVLPYCLLYFRSFRKELAEMSKSETTQGRDDVATVDKHSNESESAKVSWELNFRKSSQLWTVMAMFFSFIDPKRPILFYFYSIMIPLIQKAMEILASWNLKRK